MSTQGLRLIAVDTNVVAILARERRWEEGLEDWRPVPGLSPSLMTSFHVLYLGWIILRTPPPMPRFERTWVPCTLKRVFFFLLLGVGLP